MAHLVTDPNAACLDPWIPRPVRCTANMADNAKGLGETIRTARIAKGLGLRETAKSLDIAPSYLSDIETDRRAPSDDVMQRIATLLQIEFDDLMARAGRVGEEAERLLKRQPAAGVLFRRLAETGASGDDIERLLKQYEASKKKGSR